MQYSRKIKTDRWGNKGGGDSSRSPEGERQSACARWSTHTHTQTNTHVHAQAHAHTHACSAKHTQPHLHAHTHTTHTHIHTHLTPEYPIMTSTGYTQHGCVCWRGFGGGEYNHGQFKIHTCVNLCVWRVHLCVFLGEGHWMKKVRIRGQ